MKLTLPKVSNVRKYSSGGSNIGVIIILAGIITFSMFLGGFFRKTLKEAPIQPQAQPASVYSCCDMKDCSGTVPGKEFTFTYNNERYGLLKSNIWWNGKANHLNPSPGNATGPNGGRIFLNTSETDTSPVCPDKGGQLMDNQTKQLTQGTTHGCYLVNNDLFIYECRRDEAICIQEVGKDNAKATFDVYMRISKGEAIPEQIKQCILPTGAPESGTVTQKIITPPPGTAKDSLQIQSFTVTQEQGGRTQANWFLPWCKPAIYLYPTEKTNVRVRISPSGKMLLTIPSYPPDGWRVLAYPDGKITSGNTTYDYLYYEAQMPDTSFPKPTKGYVIPSEKLTAFLPELLKKMGLNDKETEQFVTYWKGVLPKSAYYFIGVIKKESLDYFSPLFITPRPDTVIRVTLYFQALDKFETVSPPVLSSVSRSGFTVVEWGGIFKQDKNHPFSCFM